MHFVEPKGILSSSNGMNIYRGCTHGCIYCDSRSTCYQMKHSFEDVEVKCNAPKLLESALIKKRKKCMVGTGAMSDPYMHCESDLRLMRQCLQVIDKYGHGIAVQTKSATILRDLDLLESINAKAKVVVQMTLTTYDENLCKILEPNVSSTKERFDALKVFQKVKIPTVVWISPLLPFINDTRQNLEGLMEYCFDSGVKAIMCFGIGTTMRDGSREYFYEALDKYFPGLKEKYVSNYGFSYECTSENNLNLMKLFYAQCEKYGIMHNVNQIFQYLHEFPFENSMQLSLFN